MRRPDLNGIANFKAWRVSIDPMKIEELDQTATINSWIVQCPGVHAIWDFWIMSLISLRDIDGTTPASKLYPEAEYELLFMAIDPKNGDPDPDNPQRGIPLLMPPDLVYQFHGLPEDKASEILDLCIENVMSGRIAPDSDYRRAWRKMLGNTVAHFKTARH